MMMGAHMSFPLSTVPARTIAIGGNTFQIFSHSPRTWKISSNSKEREKFKEEMKKLKLSNIALVHASYLINLSSPNEEVWKRSKRLLQNEIQMAHELGLRYVNVHPGSRLKSPLDKALERCARAIKEVVERASKDVTLLVENVSPKGGNIGWNFSQLKRIKELSECEVKFTFDTCHGFDAGYDIRTEDGMQALLNEIDETIGVENVVACHLNDSKYPLGIAKDRHERLTKGYIGREGFLNFLSCKVFRRIPLILETPGKDEEHAQDLRILKDLISLLGADK